MIINKRNFNLFLVGLLLANCVYALTDYKIDGENIADEKIEEITKGLRSNEFGKLTLTLSNLDPEKVALIAEALKANHSLSELNLSGNLGIGKEGVKSLVESIKHNKILTKLNLNTCNIGNDGAESIAELLKSNPALTSIDLTDNEISDEGGKFLAEALNSNSKVTELMLFQNQRWSFYPNTITQSIGESINRQLERNKKIANLWDRIKSYAPALLLPYQGSSFDELIPEVKLKILKKLIKLHLNSQLVQ